MRDGEASEVHNLTPKAAKKIFDSAASRTLKGLKTSKELVSCSKFSHNSRETKQVPIQENGCVEKSNIKKSYNGIASDWRSTYKESSGSAINHGVSPVEFKDQRDSVRDWFKKYNEVQKNLLLSDLLDMCDISQMHLLSLRLEQNLHKECPENCKDWVSWLPNSVAIYIFSFLDPLSLCHASQTCKYWCELASDSSLWKSFCLRQSVLLSQTLIQRIINSYTYNGEIYWKKTFSELYRINDNWMRGRCLIKTFEGHKGGISCVQFDDTRIVSGSWDTTIKVWNIKTNLPWSAQTLTGHSNTVRCLLLCGNRLVSGSMDCTIKVWDLDSSTGWSSIACKVTMIGHTGTVRCLSLNADHLVSGSYDNSLKIWDVNTGTCLKTLNGHLDHVLCVQSDSNKIISGSADKTIKIWKADGSCSNTLEGHSDAVTCLQFDSIRIISGSLDCTIKFWSISSGQCIRSIDWMASEGHTRVIRCIQANPLRLVSGSDDKTIKVWDLETGKRLVTLRYHTDGVTCLQFSDTQIVSGSYDKNVLLWDFTV